MEPSSLSIEDQLDLFNRRGVTLSDRNANLIGFADSQNSLDLESLATLN